MIGHKILSNLYVVLIPQRKKKTSKDHWIHNAKTWANQSFYTADHLILALRLDGQKKYPPNSGYQLIFQK